MKVLVTGSAGFIGSNLVAAIHARRRDVEVLTFDRTDAPEALDALAAGCDFAFHLAGENRPPSPALFMEVNRGLTERLVQCLEEAGNTCPVVLASSIQAQLDNPYGASKRAAEQVLADHGRRTGARCFVYRLPNAFGKGARPNYNSVVATFCHNASRGVPLDVREPERVLRLAYVDDIVDEFLRALDLSPARSGDHCFIPVVHEMKLSDLARTIRRFQSDFDAGTASDQQSPLDRKLYATWLSHLPRESWIHDLDMKADARGSFTEFLRMGGRGQVSVNVAKPGVTKGGHWHETKSEKFLVVSGRGRIRLRQVGRDEVTEFNVSGDRLQTVEIPAGFTHDISNVGDVDLVTVMWASEPFDPERPDTYFEPVVPPPLENTHS